MANQNRVYINSPLGTAQYVWLNKPDTKYKEDGVYKLDLVLGGKEADGFKQLITTEAEHALQRYFETEEGKKIPQQKRAKWRAYTPFKDDEDNEGNPTGYTVFKFKQNAKINLKDGTVKDVKVGIKDASGKKDVRRPIFSGTELRVAFMFRDIIMKTDQAVGVQLAIGWVQIFKLGEGNAKSSAPFDALEGGYVEEDEVENTNETRAAPSDGGGDY